MSELISKNVMVGGRTFLIQVLRFANGCFIAVTEGNEGRIGALEVSIRARRDVIKSGQWPFSGFCSSKQGPDL